MYDQMWKKTFGQNGTLTSHIEVTEGVPDSQIMPENISRKLTKDEKRRQELDEMLEEGEEEEEFWDPHIAPGNEWTSEKLTDYLCKNQDAPTLVKICKKQKNPYNCNPFFLCVFQAMDGEVEVWLSSTILYNTAKYFAQYEHANHMIYDVD